MNIARTIKLDLAKQESPLQLGYLAVAGDSPCRTLCFELYADGTPWIVPEDVKPYVAFRTSAGFSGQYDTLPTGATAVDTGENCVSVTLIDQIIANAGRVWLFLVLQDADLNRVSSFYLTFDVEKGYASGQELEQRYYRVSTLGEVNALLEQLSEQVARVDTQENLQASEEAKKAAQQAVEAAKSLDMVLIDAKIAAKGDDVCAEDGRLYLTSGGEIIGGGVELPDSAEGLAFDSGYVDEGNLLHLTLGGEDIEGFTPFALPASGGGVGSTMRLTSSMDSREFSILEQRESCEISYTWTSVDSVTQEATGSGSAEWTVGGSRVAVQTVQQGDNAFDVRKYLTAGAANSLTLKLTDSYGNVRSLSFTITVTSFGLSWNLGETGIYGEDALTLRLTPTGSGEKTVKVSVDGEVLSETTVSTTGRTLSVTVPVQSHGDHILRAWVEAAVEGQTLSTQPLKHMGIWLHEGVTTPVVAVLTPYITVGQYGTAAIRWFVADPAGETTTVTLKVGQDTVSVLENVGREVQLWSYKASTVGELDLSIECGHWVGDITLTVEGLGYDIAPVTAGLELDLDPAGHSNAEANRTSFGYLDAEGVNHPLVFSDNFDWVGGGFQTDSDGVTAFVVRRGCSVTFDRSIFDTDPRPSGRHVKLIFRSEQVRSYDAELLRCQAGNVGMTVCAQQATVGSELETMNVPYCEGRRIELDLCIQAENEGAMAWIDMKGIQSCPPVKYGTTDNWVQTNSEPLVIGSEEADVWIYRMKVYSNSLNRYEVLDNFIADCGDTKEMVARYERNDVYNDDGSLSLTKVSQRNPGLRVIHLKADRMTTGKEDEVSADFEMLYGEGGEAHHLIAQGVTFKAQGTSSLEYILAALNLDVDFSTAVSWVNGNGETITAYAMTESSIPVSYFNLKANVASSESANNVCLADEYNTFNPYICAPKAADSRVRDTVEGHPCAVFFTNTSDAAIAVGARTVQAGETILYFAGDMNNSKKNFAVFGQDNERWPMQCCVEVLNNTELPCRFRADIDDTEAFDGDGDFEFRFPKEPSNGMKEAFRAMHAWVVSTTTDLATGEAFSVPVTIGGTVYAGDTSEYRAAKFRAEFENWFVKDAMLFHRLFTDENCMTDNNAKNLFLCYEYVGELDDYRWSVRCDYDNDTGLGNDNSGGLTFSYGLELHDMVGDSYVFNAHDSTLWSNMDALMADELTGLRIRLAGTGVWDPERRSEKFRAYQAITPEAVRAEDMHNKYFVPWISADAAAYPKKCFGTKEEQREQFLQYQAVYKGSQHCDVTNRSDAISMRVTVDKAENGNLTITTYCDMYIVVMYGNGGTVKMRVKRNTPTLIECPTDSLGDTETYIFAASHLTAISSLAGMKPKFVLATTASRLRELIVGNGEVGYQNLNLNQIGVGSNEMLEKLNLQGCPNLVTALDLSALTSLEELLANGSGLTGVTFAKGAPVQTVRLPAVGALAAQDLEQLSDFLMDASELLTLRIENCPGIDSLAVCKSAPKLTRGRLTDVEWTDDNADVLVRLAGLSGLDAQGKLTEHFVLTGSAYVSEITQQELDTVTVAFPELELSYGSIVESFTVTFQNYDGAVYEDATQTVRAGGTAVNPVTAGWIETPVKEADVEYVYTFAAWDTPLGPISSDTVITARYSVSDRFYTVNHWLDEAESELMQSKRIIAHGQCEYTGSAPSSENGLWVGWDAETGDVVSDMDVHALFVTPELPDAVGEEYDYLYSNDPEASCRYTASQFYGILYYGLERDYFALGDRIKLLCSAEGFTDREIILELRSYRHFLSAERDGEFAGPYFGMVGVMNATRGMNSSNTNTGGWPASGMSAFLEEVVCPGLPQFWRALMERIVVHSSVGDTAADIVSKECWLTLESYAELGMGTNAVPYCDEVAEGADEVTFACYTDNASRIKKRYNGAGSEETYWLRSPISSDAMRFHATTYAGVAGNSYDTTSARGVAFGFCLCSGMAGGTE